jgi:hypothetical protein
MRLEFRPVIGTDQPLPICGKEDTPTTVEGKLPMWTAIYKDDIRSSVMHDQIHFTGWGDIAGGAPLCGLRLDICGYAQRRHTSPHLVNC